MLQQRGARRIARPRAPSPCWTGSRTGARLAATTDPDPPPDLAEIRRIADALITAELHAVAAHRVIGGTGECHLPGTYHLPGTLLDDIPDQVVRDVLGVVVARRTGSAQSIVIPHTTVMTIYTRRLVGAGREQTSSERLYGHKRESRARPTVSQLKEARRAYDAAVRALDAAMRHPPDGHRPQVFHALALDKQPPPLARFLANLPRAFSAMWTVLDWGPHADRPPYLPRVLPAQHPRPDTVAADRRPAGSSPAPSAAGRAATLRSRRSPTRRGSARLGVGVQPHAEPISPSRADDAAAQASQKSTAVSIPWNRGGLRYAA